LFSFPSSPPLPSSAAALGFAAGGLAIAPPSASIPVTISGSCLHFQRSTTPLLISFLCFESSAQTAKRDCDTTVASNQQ
jgi:hypothetical protein